MSSSSLFSDVSNGNTTIVFRDPKEYFKSLGAQFAVFGVNLGWTLVVFTLGWILIKIFVWLLRKILRRKQFNQTTIFFAISVINVFLKVILVIICINLLGIESLNLAAILAAIALSIGLAMSGLLQNFVSGAYLLFSRPIEVGNYVYVVGDVEGEVKRIGVVTTTILTPDLRQIIIPNSNLATNNIINYDKEDIRRCDREIKIPLTEDISLVRKIIIMVCRKDQRILDDPFPRVNISYLTEMAVVLKVKSYVKNEDYWPVYFDLQELIKIELDRCGVSMEIPVIQVNIEGEKLVKPEIDEKYRQELENALIHEVQVPELPKKHFLSQIGNVAKHHLTSWKWRKKAIEIHHENINEEEKEKEEEEEKEEEKDLEKGLS